ncbi:hypothetical protein BR93DRAFT_927352 [Coniochaeta sp. PMI_546]|nr:hypothetical protein BR93DRAFT_927352 [Coniochaeta sp. PMI_546]
MLVAFRLGRPRQLEPDNNARRQVSGDRPCQAGEDVNRLMCTSYITGEGGTCSVSGHEDTRRSGAPGAKAARPSAYVVPSMKSPKFVFVVAESLENVSVAEGRGAVLKRYREIVRRGVPYHDNRHSQSNLGMTMRHNRKSPIMNSSRYQHSRV